MDIPTIAVSGARTRDRDIHRTRFRKSLKVSAIIIAAIAVVGAMRLAEGFLLPIAIAGVLALILTPIARMLERLRLPAGIAALLAVTLSISALVAVTTYAAPSITTFIEQAPKLAKKIERRLNPILSPIQEKIGAMEDASQRLGAAATGQHSPPPTAASQESTTLFHRILGLAPDVMATALFVLILTIFFIALRKHHRRILIGLPHHPVDRLRVARTLRDIERCASGYLFDLLCINIGVGLATYLVLWAIGNSNPLMWGILLAVANFIPIIGPAAAIVVCAAWGIGTEPSLLEGLIAPAILLGIHTIEANLVEPLTYARRVEVSPLVVFLTATFFLWLWGIPGSLVAIPVLILFYTVARHFPALRPIYILMGQERKKSKNREITVRQNPFCRTESSDEVDESMRACGHKTAPRTHAFSFMTTPRDKRPAGPYRNGL